MPFIETDCGIHRPGAIEPFDGQDNPHLHRWPRFFDRFLGYFSQPARGLPLDPVAREAVDEESSEQTIDPGPLK